MSAEAWIGLGSNQDDPPQQLRSALLRLGTLAESCVDGASSLYSTPPWGITEQASFVNAVARLHTELSPRQLLNALLQMERDAGRDRRSAQMWGPRILDLDLLVYGDQHLHEPGLELPHPRLAQRAFVLVPMAELNPALAIPGLGVVAELLAALPESERSAVVPLSPIVTES